MSANCTPEKKKCSVAVNYSPNMLKIIWSCWGCRRASRSALEWKWALAHFRSKTVQACLGILCSLLQVNAVMYQTCWFTIYKWLWCRIWEFMTREVESDKRNKSHFLDIKAIQSDACHLLWSKWHQRTRRAKYFYHRDLIKHFSQKKADVRAVVVDQCRYSK